MMAGPDRQLVFVAPGVVVARAAIEAALRLERAGHRLYIEGGDAFVAPGHGVPLDDADYAAARRWAASIFVWLYHQPRASDAAPARRAGAALALQNAVAVIGDMEPREDRP